MRRFPPVTGREPLNAWEHLMRILAAGWHGQIASAFMQIAPGGKIFPLLRSGGPGSIFASLEASKEHWETSDPTS